MIKEVKISVIGIQNFGYEPEEVITTNTTGKYCYEKKTHRIEYVEIDEYGNTTKKFCQDFGRRDTNRKEWFHFWDF